MTAWELQDDAIKTKRLLRPPFSNHSVKIDALPQMRALQERLGNTSRSRARGRTAGFSHMDYLLTKPRWISMEGSL